MNHDHSIYLRATEIRNTPHRRPFVQRVAANSVLAWLNQWAQESGSTDISDEQRETLAAMLEPGAVFSPDDGRDAA